MTELELDHADAVRLATTLWAARGAHVAEIVEVTGPSGGPVRLHVEDGERALADVIARGLSVGEAVTILVPLAETVASMANRAAHRAIGVETVRLDASGAPILTAFRVAPASQGWQTLTDVAQLGVEDRAAFQALARVVLAAVRVELAEDGERVGLALLAVDQIDATRPTTLVAFAERLLTLAQPEPVHFTAAVAMPDYSNPTTAALTSGGIEASRGRVRRAIAGLRARLGVVRPRFWVPAAAVLVGLGVVVALQLPDGATGVPLAPPSPSASAHDAVGVASAVDQRPPPDPVSAALALRPGSVSGTVFDDYGDVVLVRLGTASGEEEVLIERTDSGWRLRATESSGG